VTKLTDVNRPRSSSAPPASIDEAVGCPARRCGVVGTLTRRSASKKPMRRFSLLGVALVAVLAGCSLGGPGAQSCGGTQDCGGYTAAISGWTAYPPSGSAVAAVVKRMANGQSQAKCRLIRLEARCDVAALRTEGPPGGIPIDRVWFKLQRVSGGWSVTPDCTSNPQDVLCQQLQRNARTVKTVIKD
jgi:hypothetical protein